MIKFPIIENTELYLVGGCVRDYILGRPNNDRDFVVITELPFKELVKQIKKKPHCAVYNAKEEFLTIRCNIRGKIIDLAYPRTESGYADSRHPDKVEKTKTLKEDAKRRDFTMNALYLDKNGYIHDYIGGQLDITKKIIRTVGDPKERFKEDYLRILRAIRFSSQLGFNIHIKTREAMYDTKNNLITADTQRIREELNKSFIANSQLTWLNLNNLVLYKILEKKGLKFQVTQKKLERI